MDDLLRKLGQYIESERYRFEIRHNNMFAFSFSQISRYLEFLSIIFDRTSAHTAEYSTTISRFQNSLDKSEGSHPMTSEQMHIMAEMGHCGLLIRLEIESFYLFAKILLDKIARTTEFYFGQARGISLDSHDDLAKNIEKYCSTNGLRITATLIDLIQRLKTDISDFRDYQISHHKSPRTLRGTTIDGRMIMTQFEPKEAEVQIESKHLGELLDLIEQYIDMKLTFLSDNTSKTRLTLKS